MSWVNIVYPNYYLPVDVMISGVVVVLLDVVVVSVDN